MFCCSRKTLLVLLAVASLIGLLMATGKINVNAVLPFLPILLCPLMCIIIMAFGRKGDGDSCCNDKKSSASLSHKP